MGLADGVGGSSKPEGCLERPGLPAAPAARVSWPVRGAWAVGPRSPSALCSRQLLRCPVRRRHLPKAALCSSKRLILPLTWGAGIRKGLEGRLSKAGREGADGRAACPGPLSGLEATARLGPEG